MNLIENQRAADLPAGAFQDLEERLMANIIRHCKDYDQPIATDQWLMKKLAEIGKLNQENIKIIAQSTGVSQTAMERMLNDMAEKVIKEVEPGMRQLVRQGLVGDAVPISQSKNVKQVLTTLRGQAKNTLNLCNTTMLYKARDAFKGLVNNMASTAQEIAEKQSFLDILNEHATMAVIGAESRQQALTKCIREFNEKGIPAFIDRAGREWTPEAYVNMNMRSTSNTMAAEIQMARADDYGIDLVEVDSHSGARPKCARDQGKIFDRSNQSKKYPHWKTSSYGEPDGLLGINCGHHIFPYIEGVSIRRHFPTEDLDANDKEYKEVQVQRSLERAVRKQKRECMLFDQIGDQEAFQQASYKLKAKERQLKSYVDGNDKLHRRRDREQVVGFDKRVSAKSRSSEREYIAKQTGKVDESAIRQRNQAAAENWAIKHLGIKKTNYATQSIEVVNNTNKALKKVFKEMPILKGFVDEVSFEEIDAVAIASVRLTKYGTVSTKLSLSSLLADDDQAIQQMIDQNVNAGLWTRKSGLYGIIKHEGTHLAEYSMALKRYGVNKELGGGDLPGAITAIKSHEIAEEIKQKALSACNLPDDNDIIKVNLCEYGAFEGPGEFLAEACSESPPRKLAKEVQKLFEKEMGK
ncbi:phage minor capsid protein [Diplocloster agilis]|uniref:Phage minor capsid protein n=1 Tax=Diplocloster agilis TaxID=2850323 RepID=A0A949NJ21_9FIRM|nr:phage minor capsid protein [Diplocloster agilis]MBU9739335.1 phage minor capsid protein [Diplocloster agilis]